MRWRAEQRGLAVLIGALALPAFAAAQTVHHVDASATGANNGTSWIDAFVALQDALAAAEWADEIWVAAGTYRPAGPNGDRAATFQLVSGVGVYGGFAGWETQRDQRNPAVNVTTLSGDLNQDDQPAFLGNDENVYHVVDGSATDPSAVLDGFVITGGNADHQYAPNRYGGGMYVATGTPTVANCTFLRNSADYGGGMYAREESAPVLVNCTFLGNRADSDGGGLRCSGGTPVFINCVFAGNWAGLFGGAMASGSDASPALINCSLAGNAALRVGGLSVDTEGTPVLTNCILWGNRDQGGAIEPAQASGGLPAFHYCCVQGWTGALAGDNNIDADPLWVRHPDPGPDGAWDGVDDDFGDLRLACTSPCLDGGTNATDPPLPDTDHDGGPRIVNGTVDIGAYEGPNQACLVAGGPVMMPEGGVGQFTVALACDPGGPVEVSVEHEVGDADVTVAAGQTWTFDSDDFSVGQPVVLAAADDADRVEGAARFRLTGPGFQFGTVVVREIENDIGPVVFVKADATGASNGNNWADAVRDLQEALPWATAAPRAVGAIWVAVGTYHPAGPNGDRAAFFRLANGLAVYGGFAGYESDPSERDLSNPANETILSGDLNDDDTGTDGQADNSYHVVIGTGTCETAVLDGFTITAGRASGADLNRHGAGVYNYIASPTVANCTFLGNRAIYGAAMYNYISSPAVTNCAFIGNAAAWRGGAMRNYSGSSPIVTNCAFSGNSAQKGGGVYNQWASNPVLINCRFNGNRADERGGGVYNYSDNPTLINCTFSGNSAVFEGGGIYSYADGAVLTNCVLWGNRDEGGTDESAQIHVANNWPTVSFCCIAGLDQFAGSDNIGDNPLFVRDPDSGPDGEWDGMEDDWGDLRLRCGSPCLDAGTEATDPSLPDTDLDGHPRIVEDAVDLGAYEGPNGAINLGGGPVLVPEGASSTFTVSLACDPGGPVNVWIEYEEGDTDISVASGLPLVFDPTNYWVNQTVVLVAAEDDDQLPGTTTFRVTAAGTPSATIEASEVENDITRILRVDAGAAGRGNGATWADALNEVRDALAIAAASPETVDEIWVAEGTYTPAPPGSERWATFQLVSDVGLYGGFSGWETARDQRDPALFDFTVLSGALDGDPDPVSNYDNSFHVVSGCDLDATTVLDGFTIIAGNADGQDADGCGGGLHLEAASPTVANCTLRANYALDGGAMCNRGGSSPNVTHCTFLENTTYQYGFGAGMYNLDGSNPTVVDCTFTGNYAWFGGGMLNEGSSPVVIDGNFSKNDTYYDGGGLYDLDGSSPTLIRCTFDDNTAEWGGGISHASATLTLTNCTLVGNVADLGGGIITVSNSTTLTGCRFLGNSAFGGGGWPATGGGLYAVQSSATLINCIFNGNSAGAAGGAVLSDCSEPILINCTLANNQAPHGRALGFDSIGQMCPSENAVVANSILWDGGDEIWNNDESSVTVIYSDVHGGWAGEGDIQDDPALADPEGPDDVPGTTDDDLHLLPASPCIDAGDNWSVPEAVTTDLGGNPRFVNDPDTDDTGYPPDGAPLVDLGAYEFQAVVGETIVAAISLAYHGAVELGLDLLTSNIEPRLGGLAKVQFEVTGPVEAVGVSVSCRHQVYDGATLVTADGITVKVRFDPPLPDADCCEITLTGDVDDRFAVRTLAGDVNRSGRVTTADLQAVRPHFGEAAEQANCQLDLDCSGLITPGDYSQVKPHLGNMAPLCPQAVPKH